MSIYDLHFLKFNSKRKTPCDCDQSKLDSSFRRGNMSEGHYKS